MPHVKSAYSLIWRRLAPLRVEYFCCLAVFGKICTKYNLKRRGMASKTISDHCLLCRRYTESIDHLLIHCYFSYSLWCYFLAMCSILQCLPNSLFRLIEGWGLAPFLGFNVVMCRMIPHAILGMVWKEMNDRMLRGALMFCE